jgi:uncharacterized protein (TIGR02118 family)
MTKVLLFVKRKPGLTAQAFKDRYESGHVPLAIRELPYLRRYQRNFVVHAEGRPEPDFDAVTELWFDDQEAWNATCARARDPNIARILTEDEAEFMDRSSMRIVIVDERTSDVDAARLG